MTRWKTGKGRRTTKCEAGKHARMWTGRRRGGWKSRSRIIWRTHRQYTYNIILWHVCVNHYCNGKATTYSECVSELHVAVNSKKIIFFFSHKCFYGKFSLPAKIKLYLGLHIMCPIFLSNFNQTWNFSRHSHESPQYQISWKFVERELHWPCGNRRTDTTKLNGAFCDYVNVPTGQLGTTRRK